MCDTYARIITAAQVDADHLLLQNLQVSPSTAPFPFPPPLQFTPCSSNATTFDAKSTCASHSPRQQVTHEPLARYTSAMHLPFTAFSVPGLMTAAELQQEGLEPCAEGRCALHQILNSVRPAFHPDAASIFSTRRCVFAATCCSRSLSPAAAVCRSLTPPQLQQHLMMKQEMEEHIRVATAELSDLTACLAPVRAPVNRHLHSRPHVLLPSHVLAASAPMRHRAATSSSSVSADPAFRELLEQLPLPLYSLACRAHK